MIHDQDVRDAIITLDSPGIYSVEAEAGGGKTTLCLDFMEFNHDKRVVYVTFTNAAAYDAKEKYAQRKVQSNHVIQTFNAYCLMLLSEQNIVVPFMKEFVRAVELAGLVSGGYNDKSRYNAFLAVFKEAMVKATTLKELKQYEKIINAVFTSKQTGTNDQYCYALQIALVYLHCKFTKRIKAPLGDVLIIDEAQDLDPFHLEILKMLPFETKLFVGDTKQSIYGFEDRVNVFRTPYYKTMQYHFKLDTTFRFSQAVCDCLYGNGIIQSASNNQTQVKSYRSTNDLPAKSVILFPTNRELIDLVVDRVTRDQPVALRQNRLSRLKTFAKNRRAFVKKFVAQKERRNGVKSMYLYAMKLKKQNHFLWTYYHRTFDCIDDIFMFVQSGKITLHSKNTQHHPLVETVHGFKGLEQTYVYVARSCSPLNSPLQGDWYDKNCVYNVALTRATGILYLPEEWVQDALLPPFTKEEVAATWYEKTQHKRRKLK